MSVETNTPIAVAVELAVEPVMIMAELLNADFTNDDEAEFVQEVLNIQEDLEEILEGDNPENFFIPDEDNLSPAMKLLERLENLKSFAFGERTIARMERAITGNQIVYPKLTETEKANHPNYTRCPNCSLLHTKGYIKQHLKTKVCVKVETAQVLRPISISKKADPTIYSACVDLADLIRNTRQYKAIYLKKDTELVEELIEDDDSSIL
jgi:hypothetical protein